MRVLQIIDTLQPGGAERMAVSYADLLHKNGHVSFLCCTRLEGVLKEQIGSEIGYQFLNKKSVLDFLALYKLRKFVIKNRIEIVHAHGTSYFFASLLKILGLSFKLVWHDHYGESELLEKRTFKILKMCSSTFNGIISVNQKLKNWANEHLNTEHVTMINNFIQQPNIINDKKNLDGPEEAFKIICLANLRPQKDHFNLLSSFEILAGKINATLHLIGNDPQTYYSKKVLDEISKSEFKNQIFYYGIQTDVLGYLKNADLGVLSSRSEGLPLALLEYGVAGLPVIVTNVGQCEEVLKGFGIVVPPKNSEILSESILGYYKKNSKRLVDAMKFKEHVSSEYGEDLIYKQIIDFYIKL